MMRWLACLLLMIAGVAHAQTFPPLTGRVVDAANIIPDDQEAALTAKLDALEKESSRQLVVATVPNLEGYDIADYGYRLGRSWGIGQKDQNNGAILLVAPNDRKVRIEVGYGLEPILTDAFSSVIINTQIVPAFKAGDFPGGITAGTDAIIAQLRLPPEEAADLQAAAAAQGLAYVYLLAPTSSPRRIAAVAERARGFVYLVSVAGVTGARQTVGADLAGFIERVRARTTTPLAVGFGISTPEQAATIGRLADGVIVGSALINAVDRAESDKAGAAANFVRALREALERQPW